LPRPAKAESRARGRSTAPGCGQQLKRMRAASKASVAKDGRKPPPVHRPEFSERPAAAARLAAKSERKGKTVKKHPAREIAYRRRIKPDKRRSDAFVTRSVIAVAAAIGSAALGYLVGVMNDIRKSKLDFVNSQIEKLYGPLYAQTQANNATWEEFTRRYWRTYRTKSQKQGDFFYCDDKDPPTIEEVKRWRAWMKAVFQPLNLEMEKAIVENSQLIIGDNIPVVFKEVVAQTEAYKFVISGWKDNDFEGCRRNPTELCPQLSYASNTTPLNYPTEIITCVEQDYQTLKKRQAGLEQSFLLAALFDSAPQRSEKCDAPKAGNLLSCEQR
jgi:ABC-type cobalt transport system substrate-binding protein